MCVIREMVGKHNLEDVGAGLKVILKGLKSEQVDWFDLA
jgi:hypothetical protein